MSAVANMKPAGQGGGIGAQEGSSGFRGHSTLDPHVRALADAACRDLGLSPWLVLHRPRLHARIAAFSAMTAQVRADAMRVQGKRARGRDGRFIA